MTTFPMKFWMGIVLCGSLLGLSRRAVAHEFEYSAILTGPGGATGTADVLIDLDIVTLDVDLTFAGLSNPTTTAFIHGRTALPNTGAAIQALPLPAFPSGLTAGTSHDFIDLAIGSSYTSAFIAASGGTVSDALNATYFGLDASQMYIQINDANGPSLSGFLIPLLPEPASLGLLGIGVVGFLRRRI